MSSAGQNITSVLKETRVFSPSDEFVAAAHVPTAEADTLRAWANDDPDAFWAEQAKSLHWDHPWTKVLDWSHVPHAKWFVGGKLNASANCLDRHIAALFPHAHLPATPPRSLQVRERPEDARRP